MLEKCAVALAFLIRVYINAAALVCHAQVYDHRAHLDGEPLDILLVLPEANVVLEGQHVKHLQRTYSQYCNLPCQLNMLASAKS